MEDYLQDFEEPEQKTNRLTRTLAVLTSLLLFIFLCIQFYFFIRYGLSLHEFRFIAFIIIGIDLLLGLIIYLLEKRNRFGWTLLAILSSFLLGMSLISISAFWGKDHITMSWPNICLLAYIFITAVTQLILLYNPQTRHACNVSFNFFAASAVMVFCLIGHVNKDILILMITTDV